jgi:hypothetical protein
MLRDVKWMVDHPDEVDFCDVLYPEDVWDQLAPFREALAVADGTRASEWLDSLTDEDKLAIINSREGSTPS